MYQFHVPGFNRGNPQTTHLFYSGGGAFHNLGIHPVAGKSQDPGSRTSRQQDIIIFRIRIFITVMSLNRSYRCSEKRILKSLAKKFPLHTDRSGCNQGIHVHPDFLPFFVVADSRIPHALSAGTRHLITAGAAVAYRTSFTNFTNHRSGLS